LSDGGFKVTQGLWHSDRDFEKAMIDRPNFACQTALSQATEAGHAGNHRYTR